MLSNTAHNVASQSTTRRRWRAARSSRRASTTRSGACRGGGGLRPAPPRLLCVRVRACACVRACASVRARAGVPCVFWGVCASGAGGTRPGGRRPPGTGRWGDTLLCGCYVNIHVWMRQDASNLSYCVGIDAWRCVTPIVLYEYYRVEMRCICHTVWVLMRLDAPLLSHYVRINAWRRVTVILCE